MCSSMTSTTLDTDSGRNLTQAKYSLPWVVFVFVLFCFKLDL